MTDRCVVLVAGAGPSTRMVYHGLRQHLPAGVRLEVIVEEGMSRRRLLARRVERLGALTVLGQLLFMIGIAPLLRLRGRARITEIIREHGLDDRPLLNAHRVGSANEERARSLLRSLAPAVVVVNGTRILSKRTLECADAPFINMHAGITPAYRGVHGGYWALAEGRPDLVGTTIHRVDEGIDTGEVVEQVRFAVTNLDNFATYPYLHTAAGLPALSRAVESALQGRLSTQSPDPELPSRLRYHPTIWSYGVNRLRAGAR